MLIVNSFTEEERECRVVYVDSKTARAAIKSPSNLPVRLAISGIVCSPPARLEVALRPVDLIESALSNT